MKQYIVYYADRQRTARVYQVDSIQQLLDFIYDCEVLRIEFFPHEVLDIRKKD